MAGTTGRLSWRLLPAVGGPPARRNTGEEHLSARVLPSVVAIGEHVLVMGGRDPWQTDDFGRPRPPEIGSVLAIDRQGHEVGRWTLDWHVGDRAAVVNGLVFLVGPGSDGVQRALVFDPAEPEHSERYDSVLAARAQPAAFTGEAFVVWGGELSDDAMAHARRRTRPTDDGAVFDVFTRQWSPMPASPLAARSRHVLEAAGHDVVIWGGSAFGASGRRRPVADGAVYDAQAREWRAMSPAPLGPRSGASAAGLGRRVFIGAGSGGESTRYASDAAMYSPGTDTWAQAASPRWWLPGAATFAIGDLVVMSGGTSAGADPPGSMLIYDTACDAWSSPDAGGFLPGSASFAALSPDEAYAWSGFNPTTEHAVLVGVAAFSAAGERALVRRYGGVEVDPRLIDGMAASLGAVHVQLRGVADPDLAIAAMKRAREALFAIPHPEEPDDPLPSFASDVTLAPNGPTFWFDIADAGGDVLHRVIQTLAEAAAGTGASGLLTVDHPGD